MQFLMTLIYPIDAIYWPSEISRNLSVNLPELGAVGEAAGEGENTGNVHVLGRWKGPRIRSDADAGCGLRRCG